MIDQPSQPLHGQENFTLKNQISHPICKPLASVVLSCALGAFSVSEAFAQPQNPQSSIRNLAPAEELQSQPKFELPQNRLLYPVAPGPVVGPATFTISAPNEPKNDAEKKVEDQQITVETPFPYFVNFDLDSPEVQKYIQRQTELSDRYFGQPELAQRIRNWRGFFERDLTIPNRYGVTLFQGGKFYKEKKDRPVAILYQQLDGQEPTVWMDPQEARFQMKSNILKNTLPLEKNSLGSLALNKDNSLIKIQIQNQNIEFIENIFILNRSNQIVAQLIDVQDAYWDAQDPNKIFLIRIDQAAKVRRVSVIPNVTKSLEEVLISQVSFESDTPYPGTYEAGLEMSVLMYSGFGKDRLFLIDPATQALTQIFEPKGEDKVVFYETKDYVMYKIAGNSEYFNHTTEFGLVAIYQKKGRPISEMVFNEKNVPDVLLQGTLDNVIECVCPIPNQNKVVLVERDQAFGRVFVLDIETGVKKQLNVPLGKHIACWNSSTQKVEITSRAADMTTTIFTYDPISEQVITVFENYPNEDIGKDFRVKKQLIKVEQLPRNSSNPADTLPIPYVELSSTSQVELEKKQSIVFKMYSGFEQSVFDDLDYNGADLMFIKNGGIVVFAGPPGGNENGKAWGNVSLDKYQTYQGSIQVLEDVVKRYPNSQISLEGGSNGGLVTMGTVLTIMLNPQYHYLLDHIQSVTSVSAPMVLDATLLAHFPEVTRGWSSEYGDPLNPAEQKEMQKTSIPHMLLELEKAILKGQIPASIIAKAPVFYIFIDTNDKRVHPSHGLRVLAMLQKMRFKAVAVFNDGGHDEGDSSSNPLKSATIISSTRQGAQIFNTSSLWSIGHDSNLGFKTNQSQ